MMKKIFFCLLPFTGSVLLPSFNQLSTKYEETHARAVVVYKGWITVMNEIQDHRYVLSAANICKLYGLQTKKPEHCKKHESVIQLRLQERKLADSNKLEFIDENLDTRIRAYGAQVELLNETVQTLSATMAGFLSQEKTPKALPEKKR